MQLKVCEEGIKEEGNANIKLGSGSCKELAQIKQFHLSEEKEFVTSWWQVCVGVDQKSVHPLAANDGGFLSQSNTLPASLCEGHLHRYEESINNLPFNSVN